MDKGTQASEAVEPGDIATGDSEDSDLCKRSEKQGGPTLELGKAFIKTVYHFWPSLRSWLDQLPDTRFEPMVIYDRRFLTWWGIILFVLKLGSRRQLDHDLRDEATFVLDNTNRLAGTNQITLPVHNTLEHFLGHVGWKAFSCLRTLINERFSIWVWHCYGVGSKTEDVLCLYIQTRKNANDVGGVSGPCGGDSGEHPEKTAP